MTITEHPAYGTCAGCTQGKRVDKRGRIKPHTRKVARGNVVLDVQCAGSNGPYAEVARTEWNPRLGRWQDMPLQVDAFMHMAGGEEPEPIYVEVFPSTDAKRGHGLFRERGLSLHFLPVFTAEGEEPTAFHTELRNRDGRVVLEEPEAANDGDSVSLLVLRLLERIGKDTAGAKGVQA